MIVLFRHGESRANVAEIIASDLNVLGRSMGLTEVGRVQVRQAARNLILSVPSIKKDGYVIFFSPFLRTAQTAEEIRDVIGEPKLFREEDRLRERYFGKFEGKSTDHYEEVWVRDRTGQSVSDMMVEELKDVQARTQHLIKEIETEYSSIPVILVTHGDVASNILATYYKESLARHREVGGLKTAEFRVLGDFI